MTILYPSALTNAQDGAKHPPLSEQYQAHEIEFFVGATPSDSICHFKGGELIDFNLNNAGIEPVYQVLIDHVWAYVEADGQVLLDRLGGFVLPQIPKQQTLDLTAIVVGVEP